MTTVKEVMKELQEIAIANQKRNDEVKIIDIPHLEDGQCYRQGDLNIFKMADNHPVGKKLDRRQLADGQSIGQRHVLLGAKFQVYEGVKAPAAVKDGEARLGYAFDVLSNDCRNAHPEHVHFKFHQQGRYQVMHQLDRQTLQRMAD